MKKIILLLLLFTFFTTSYCQQTETKPTFTKQDYLKKSKRQKTKAFIFLGAGTATLALAAQIDNTLGAGGALAFIGGFIEFISLIYFLDSNKNKRKAMSMSFKMQSLPQLQKDNFINNVIPSLNLKISL
jgi:hypothetical protein